MALSLYGCCTAIERWDVCMTFWSSPSSIFPGGHVHGLRQDCCWIMNCGRIYGIAIQSVFSPVAFGHRLGLLFWLI